MKNALRVVVDTNVLVSALLSRDSPPGKAMTKAEETGVLLASADTLQELDEVLRRPKFSKYLSMETRLEFIRGYKEVAQLVFIVTAVRACRDPRDDKFLEAAVNGQGEVIVTSDGDLLVLDPFQGVRILSPRGYLAFNPDTDGKREDI